MTPTHGLGPALGEDGSTLKEETLSAQGPALEKGLDHWWFLLHQGLVLGTNPPGNVIT